MSSSVWRAFSGLPQPCTSTKVPDGLTNFFMPGYGDYRRRPVKQRRSHKLSRKSHLDMYLDHSLQAARLGDLWSSTSTSSWPDLAPELDAAAAAAPAHTPVSTQLCTNTFPAATDDTAASCSLAQHPQTIGPHTSASASTSTTSSSSAPSADAHAFDQFAPTAKLPAHPGSVGGSLKAEAAGTQLNTSQVLLQAFLACLVLLPMLWSLQQVVGLNRQEHSALMGRLRLWACCLFIPLFLYLTAQLPAESWAACTAHLRFPEAATEARFATWFATWTWHPDALLCAAWTAASLYAWSHAHPPGSPTPATPPASIPATPYPSPPYPLAPPFAPPAARPPAHPDAAGRWLSLASSLLLRPAAPPAAPALARWLTLAGILLPLLLRAAAHVRRGRPSPLRRHDLALVCVKLIYTAVDAALLSTTTAAAAATPSAPPQPHAACRLWLLLAPLLPMRVAAFLPPQVLHVLVVVLLGPPGQRTVLLAAQVAAVGVGLPTLWLYAKERRGRRLFVALGLSKHAAALPAAAAGGARAAVARLCAGGT